MGLFASKCYLCKKKNNLIDVEITSKKFTFHPMCLIEYALSRLPNDLKPHCRECKEQLDWIREPEHLYFECRECNITYNTNYVNLEILNLYGKENEIKKIIDEISLNKNNGTSHDSSKFSCDYCLKFFDRMTLWKSDRDPTKLICLNCKKKIREDRIKLEEELIESTLENERVKQNREKLDKQGRALPQGFEPNIESKNTSITPEIDSKLNYSGENLSFQSFEGANLTNCKFQKSNLKCANFSNTILKNCDFTGADLTETDFTGADLTHANFFDSNLTGTKFSNAKLWSKTDDGGNTIHVDINELLKSNLKGIKISNLKLNHFNLTGKNFTGADLSNGEFVSSDHSLAIFEDANLEGIRLYSCDLRNCNFSNTNLKNSDLSYSNMTGVDLSDAKIDGANFTNCIMIDTILENIDKNKANFSGVRFEERIPTENEKKYSQLLEKIKKIKFNASMTLDCSNQIMIYPNAPDVGEISFYIEPFIGTEHFATLISGGNFDFRDDDSSQYIISIKFRKINTKIYDLLVSEIRHCFPKKFKIFTSNLSIGAYWMVDSVDEKFASEILQRILTKFAHNFYSSK